MLFDLQSLQGPHQKVQLDIPMLKYHQRQSKKYTLLTTVDPTELVLLELKLVIHPQMQDIQRLRTCLHPLMNKML